MRHVSYQAEKGMRVKGKHKLIVLDQQAGCSDQTMRPIAVALQVKKGETV